MELPPYSVVKHTAQGYVARLKNPKTGRPTNVALWTRNERVPKSKRTRAEARRRAPDRVAAYIGQLTMVSAISAGAVSTVRDFFAVAHDDPGARGKLSPDTLKLRVFSLELFRSFLASAGVNDFSPVADITRQHIEEYKRKLAKGGIRTPEGNRSRPASERSIVRHVGIVKRAFNYALQDRELIGLKSSPAKHVTTRLWKNVHEQRQVVRDRSISDETFQTLLAASLDSRAPFYMHAALTVMSETGVRRGELVSARWDGIQESGAGAMLRVSGKTGIRLIPLLDSTVAYLDQWRARLHDLGIRSPWILCNENGTPLNPTSLNQAFRRIRNRLGIDPSVRLYGLRHRYAHKLAKRAPMNTVAAAMGHADIRTTSIYTFTDVETQAEVIRQAFQDAG